MQQRIKKILENVERKCRNMQQRTKEIGGNVANTAKN